MPLSNPQARRDYQRDLMRRRRAKARLDAWDLFPPPTESHSVEALLSLDAPGLRRQRGG